MKTIWKFEISIDNTVDLKMPADAQTLHVAPGAAHGELLLWAVVDPGKEAVTRRLYVRGTGHPMGEAALARHVGTAQAPPFVWHVFDGGQVLQP